LLLVHGSYEHRAKGSHMIRSRRVNGAAAAALAFALASFGFGPSEASQHQTPESDAEANAALHGPTNCNDMASVLKAIAPPDSTVDPQVRALINRLRSGDADVFRGASGQLSTMGTTALPALAEALLDPDPEMRSSVSYTIARMEPIPTVALPLLSCHLRDPDYRVREHVVSAIGRTRFPTAIAPLMAALRDPERSVKQEAVRALAEFGPAAQPAIPVLVQLLHPQLVLQGAGDVGLDAAAAFGRIGPVAIPALVAALDDGMPLAPMALAKIGSAGVPPLIEALHHPNRKARLGAIRALGDAKPPAIAAVPALIAMLRDQEEGIRGHSAVALSEMGKGAAAAVPALVTLLGDTERWPRMMAAKALGKIGIATDAAVIGLVRTLADSDEDVREYAIESLGSLHSRADVVVPALLEIAINGRRDERWSAVRALGDFGSDAGVAVPVLVGMLQKSDSLADEAANALRRIGPTSFSTIPQFVAALDHPSFEVVWNSANVLSQMAAVAPEAAAALANCVSQAKRKLPVSERRKWLI
jgi:HEAT repeat protein